VGWKGSFLDRRSKETIISDWENRHHNELTTFNRKPSCPRCSKEGYQVPLSTRAPKHNDKKGWILLRKLIDNEDLSRRKGYLSSVWSFGNMIHQPNHIRQAIWVPHKLYEYDEWVNFMNTTKIPK
jgi:hypothetical protein